MNAGLGIGGGLNGKSGFGGTGGGLSMNGSMLSAREPNAIEYTLREPCEDALDELRESTALSRSARGDGVPRLLMNCSDARYETKRDGSSTGVISGMTGELGDIALCIEMRARGSLGARVVLVTMRMAGAGVAFDVRGASDARGRS